MKKLLILFSFVGLSIWSLIVIFICRLKSTTIGHYQIDINNNDCVFDTRSKWVHQLIEPGKTVNFFHSTNLSHTLRTFYKKPNSVYFEVLIEFIVRLYPIFKYFICRSNLFHPKLTSNSNHDLLLKVYITKILFKYLKLDLFLFLDDSRHTGILRLACKELGIKTIAYMHACAPGEFKPKPLHPIYDVYFVWSPYFKQKLLEYNPDYIKKMIFCIGRPNLVKTNTLLKTNHIIVNVLWVGESTPIEFVSPYIDELLKNDKIQIFFRPKPSFKYDDFNKVINSQVIRDITPNLYESLLNNQINLVIGTLSSVLMESWAYGIPSIALFVGNDYARHLWDDDISPLCEVPEDLMRLVHEQISLPYEERYAKGRKIWGNDLGRYDTEYARKLFHEIGILKYLEPK